MQKNCYKIQSGLILPIILNIVVLEVCSKGYNQKDISSIASWSGYDNKDIPYLRCQDKDNIKKYIDYLLHEEHEKYLCSIFMAILNTLSNCRTSGFCNEQ